MFSIQIWVQVQYFERKNETKLKILIFQNFIFSKISKISIFRKFRFSKISFFRKFWFFKKYFFQKFWFFEILIFFQNFWFFKFYFRFFFITRFFYDKHYVSKVSRELLEQSGDRPLTLSVFFMCYGVMESAARGWWRLSSTSDGHDRNCDGRIWPPW